MSVQGWPFWGRACLVSTINMYHLWTHRKYLVALILLLAQHVFADTLRSIAVLVAACLSVLVPEITPEEADASAAVVVSGLIILSLIPLFNGLVQTFHELRMIQAEEKSDEMVFSS